MVVAMNKLPHAFLALCLCLPLLLCAQQSPAAAQAGTAMHEPPEPALTHRPPGPAVEPGLIKLSVVVTDKSGKPVSGLELKDFTLLDNNLPAKILSFHAIDGTAQKADSPVQVILLLDAINLDFQQVSIARQDIEKFLRQNGGHLAQPVSIFIFLNEGVKVLAQPSTDGNAQAASLSQVDSQLRMIGRSQGRYGDIDRFYLSIRMLTSIAQGEVSIPGRKLLIWTGHGWPMLDWQGLQISSKTEQQLFDSLVELSTRLREAHIVLYSISSGQAGMGTFLYQGFLKGVKSAQKANPPNVSLKVLAIQSGGRVLGPDNDLAAQIDNCVQDANAFYTLSFDPPRADKANEYHDLKVQIDRPGLKVQTTTGYYNQP